MSQLTPWSHDRSYLNVTSTMTTFPLPNVSSRMSVNLKIEIYGKIIITVVCKVLIACNITHSPIHPCMHVWMDAWMHTYIQTYMHTYIHTYIRTCVLKYVHKRTFARTHICMYVRTYVHRYIRTYTPAPPFPPHTQTDSFFKVQLIWAIYLNSLLGSHHAMVIYIYYNKPCYGPAIS